MDKREIEEAVEIGKGVLHNLVEIGNLKTTTKELIQQSFYDKQRCLETLLSLAQLFLEAQRVMPQKKEIKTEDWQHYDLTLGDVVYAENKMIDACTAHLAGKADGIEKILEGFITHILWYHDKEGGRTEDVEIIFKSRFKNVAQAITEIKSLFKSKIKHIDKEAWDKANSLNPDSVEYLNAYERANTLSQALTEIEKRWEEI